MGRLVSWQMLVWGSWALISPLVWRMARRWPLDRSRNTAHALANVAGGSLFLLLHLATTVWLTRTVAPMAWARSESFSSELLSTLRSRAIFEAIIVVGIIAVANWMREAEAARRRTVAAAELETALARAELRALQVQIQPHFLFNALHSVAGLVRDGRRDEAVDTIASLSDLLRYVLENGDRSAVPLEEEIDFIERYLAVQKARFGDKLVVETRIDPTIRRVTVPNLILQPLVENAVTHGVARLPRGGVITIEATPADGHVRLSVRNQGPPIERSGVDDPSIGLANTRSRLQWMYGGAATFEVGNVRDGVEATLRIPMGPLDER